LLGVSSSHGAIPSEKYSFLSDSSADTAAHVYTHAHKLGGGDGDVV